MAAAPITITICMGSSCFSRGNNTNLHVLQQYIAEHGLDAHIELMGSRCEGQCMQGPNIRINDTLYHGVDAATLLRLLAEHVQQE
ncbi:MAG TPA: (2Fe-2S) ferredoxin domain-containing protein [Armatimonadota bacterium]|nr:(2Fe-2S) ferredoxin domain-containing protein [Armatimonadota bacterium]